MRLLLALLLTLSGALPFTCVPGVPPGPDADRPGYRLPALHAEPDPVSGGRIVDAFGREVLLRGVNVNAHVEYWAYDPALPTVFPLTPADADALAALGWNAVRLLLSWSRVEPQPGVYDDAYLDEIEASVALLESRGLYAILDLHQDAWGATLANPGDDDCADIGGTPAFGWDGAPGWATQDAGRRRCVVGGIRELAPAVQAAFDAFWRDRPGPDGVGIRTRYVRMLAHVARRLATYDAVAGYDVMNEPNAFNFQQPGELLALSALYGDALAAIRAAEAEVGAPPRLLFFEPSITWAGFGVGAPPPFPHDGQIVYAPHLYQGGLDDQPLDENAFLLALNDAAAFGGAPIVSGEWGADPRRAGDPSDRYFERHLALQDAFRFGSTLWTWREACGDPHKAGDARAGNVPFVWGLFDLDCVGNTVRGMRDALVQVLRRPALRAAPGPIDAVAWDPDARRYTARGSAAARADTFILFAPLETGTILHVERSGLYGVHRTPAHGGQYVVGWAEGGDWELAVELR